MNPYAEMAYDGVDLNPMEVLFVKVKTFLLQAAWVAPTWAQTYDRWLTRQVIIQEQHHPSAALLLWSWFRVIPHNRVRLATP